MPLGKIVVTSGHASGITFASLPELEMAYKELGAAKSGQQVQGFWFPRAEILAVDPHFDKTRHRSAAYRGVRRLAQDKGLDIKLKILPVPDSEELTVWVFRAPAEENTADTNAS